MSPEAATVLRLLGNAGGFQADIAHACQMPVRSVQAACEELRLAGYPVVSGCDGIRLAQTADEARACSEALRRRLVTQYRTLRAMRATARRMKEEEDARSSQTFWDFYEELNPSAMSKSA